MRNDLWRLEITQLETLYRLESERLQKQLLAGASWEDVRELREQIGELYTLIYKKNNAAYFTNPAEKPDRRGISPQPPDTDD